MPLSIGYEVGSDGKPLVRRFWNTREDRYMTVLAEIRPGGMVVAAEIDPVLAPQAPTEADLRFVPHDTRGPGDARPATDVTAGGEEFRGSDQVHAASPEAVRALQAAQGIISTDGSVEAGPGATDARALLHTEGASADSDAGALQQLAEEAGLGAPGTPAA